VSNIIVLCQFFPGMFVGFNVKVECESLVKNCEYSEVHDLFATVLWVDNPRKVTWEAHAGIWTVFCQAIFCGSFRDLANPRV